MRVLLLPLLLLVRPMLWEWQVLLLLLGEWVLLLLLLLLEMWVWVLLLQEPACGGGNGGTKMVDGLRIDPHPSNALLLLAPIWLAPASAHPSPGLCVQ